MEVHYLLDLFFPCDFVFETFFKKKNLFSDKERDQGAYYFLNKMKQGKNNIE